MPPTLARRHVRGYPLSVLPLSRSARLLVVLVGLTLSGCQTGPTSAPAPVATTKPPVATSQAITQPPRVAPTAPVVQAPPVAQAPRSTAAPSGSTPVPLGTSRVQVLAAANEAFARGDLAVAAELYERVASTVSGATEPVDRSTLEGVAQFRAIMARLLLGDEEVAEEHLRELESQYADEVFAALARQFWHTYTMTADVGAACAQTTPQVVQLAATPLTALRTAGVTLEPAALCTVPR